MRRTAIGFLIGVAGLQQLSSLPDGLWSVLLLALIPVVWFFPKWRLIIFIGIGFLWANLFGQILLANGLDPGLESKDVVVEGYIVSLPEAQSRRVRFHFLPDTIHKDGVDQLLPGKQVPGKLLLSWYEMAPSLNVGERWRLQVRLKQPHGFMNPGGFDYEAWLFRQGIRAKGYVRKAEDINLRLSEASIRYPVEQIRQILREKLENVLHDHELHGVVMALAIGDRQQINRDQWEVLTRTGTNHLVAISGLHVGLVAGFAFFAVRRLWRLSATAVLYWPAAKAGALAGLLAAVIYAALAGFSVPTQRALVMITVVMLAVILQRRTRASSLLALALLLVLLIDPMAVLAPGFWLSFTAVAIILYGMMGRLGVETGWRKWWWRWGRVQWLVAVGLLPILVLLFQKASVVSPLANLVAVPWVSLVTVPLTLLGTVFLGLIPVLAELCLGLALWSLDVLWWVLQSFSQWRFAQWAQAVPATWTLVCAVLGLLWLLAPHGIPGRWVGGVWMLPLVFSPPSDIPVGEARFALLDVGQGLAAVVQTRQHTLVFDTGPRYSTGFNTGGAVVVPYLREKGVGHIDTLVVSHGDNDHIGGAEDLAAQIPVTRAISSVPDKLRSLLADTEKISGVIIDDCRAGERWQWDGVWFELLNPVQTETSQSGRKANNRSCVLRIEAGDDSVLLSGDIEHGAERDLVHRLGEKMASDILVVPHHGSKTSSSPVFLDTVKPRTALFPVGYRNRYDFPRAAVVQRYEKRDVRLFDSASHGAIEIQLGVKNSKEPTIQTWRQKEARYWHYQPPSSANGPVTSDKTVSLLQ